MRMCLIAASALGCAVAFGAPAQAQYFQPADPAFYLEGGYSHYQADNPDVSLGAAQIRAGWEFNEFLGAEADAAIGIADDSVAGVTVDLNHQYGVYARGKVAFTDRFSGHVRVGYSSVDLDVSSAGASSSSSDDGVAYGVGGTFMFTDRQGLRADYTRHEFDDAIDNISVSYVYRFGR